MTGKNGRTPEPELPIKPEGVQVDLFSVIGQKQIQIEVLQQENAALRAQVARLLTVAEAQQARIDETVPVEA